MSHFKEFIAKLRNVVPMEKRNKKVVFFFILLVTMLDNLNVSAAFVSTTNIQEKFNAKTTEVTWVVAAYALTLGSFIVFFGKTADIVGVHNVFLMGAACMSLFSLIIAVIEKSIIALIIFRALQGMSGAAIIPSAFGLTANYFQGPQLRVALKFLVIALTASMGLGMILGGAFAESKIGYKGFYYLSFAISFISAVFLFFNIIPARRTDARRAMKFKNLDFYATGGIIVGMLLIILGFTEGGVKWKDPKAYVPLPIGVLILIAVFIFEVFYIGRFQKKNPTSNNWKSRILMIFPSQILELPNFKIFIPALLCIFLSYISANLALVDFHTYVMGDSPILTAIKIFPLSAGIVLMALVFNFSYALKVGYKNCLLASCLVQTMMFVWICRLDYRATHSYWKYEFIPLIIYGAACNVYFQVYLNVIMAPAPIHLQANISGICQTASQIGISLGSAVTSTFIGNISSSTTRDALQTKISNSLYFSVAASALSFIIVIFSDKNAVKPPPKVVPNEPKQSSEGENKDSSGENSHVSEKDIEEQSQTNDENEQIKNSN